MVIALHGFLGLPDDWQPIASRMAPRLAQGTQGPSSFEAVDLWSEARAMAAECPELHVNSPFENCWFERWTEHFKTRLVRAISATGKKPWLIGYSMGGRLALHAAIKLQGLLSGLVLVSVNYGLGSLDERESRLGRDHAWAMRLRSGENWERVLADWNAQPVLKPGSSDEGIFLERVEGRFDRATLAMGLEGWSLARQSDRRAELAAIGLPVLHVSGEEDRSYTKIVYDYFASQAAVLQATGLQKHVVVPKAGHRVPWDAPEAFGQAVCSFIWEVGA
jgi:2-succinyl-6-hydroxy-2,4-cyclohexadiene-1-carboxylate synthase